MGVLRTLSQEVLDLVGVELAHGNMVRCRSVALGRGWCTCSFALASPGIAGSCRRCLLSAAFLGGVVRARAAVLGLAIPLAWTPPAVHMVSSFRAYHAAEALPVLSRAAHCRNGEDCRRAERGAVVEI
jgi:hypothetical protein